MKNYAILVMDYYLDALRVTGSKEKAEDMAKAYLYKMREQMTRDDNMQMYAIISRMANA